MTAFTADAAGALGGPQWLVGRRVAAAERLAGTPLPSEAEEIWRYSGIDDFSLDAFAPAPPSAGSSAAALDRARRLADDLGPRSALVITCDGIVLAVDAGPGAPAGLVRAAGAGPLAQSLPAQDLGMGSADGDGASGEGAVGTHDAFGALHDAFMADVVVVTVPADVVLEEPIMVVHLAGAPAPAAGPGPAAFPRTVVRLGRSARAGVVELLAPADEGAAGGPGLVVPVADLVVGDGAALAYANLQTLGAATTHVGLQASRIGRDAVLRSFTVGLGGRYARVRTDSDLVGTGGRSTLLAAYLGTGDQVHDFRTLQDHHAGHTQSELLFTGAVADTSRSVYSGLIRIRRGARRSDARQTNHNLVLSEGAHADSVPNLDIDENDVRCSHASTVGPIDEEQRYYLESRGIEPAAAERLIVRGFFADMAGRSPFPDVGRWVARVVEQRLAGRLPAERGDDALAGSRSAGGTDG